MARLSLTHHLIRCEREHGLDPDLRLLLEVIARAVKAHQPRGRQGRPRRRARPRGDDERPGRGAEEARRAVQRDPGRGQQLGRLPGRHGVGGNGRPGRHSGGLPARQVPAAVRPARRLEQHRRQRVGRHDLLGAEVPGRRHRTRRERLPAAGHRAGVRRLRRVRTADAADADHRPRRRRLHARPRHRLVPADPRERADSRGHRRVRDQRLQRAALGAARQALHRRTAGREDRPARARLQHALGGLDGGRRAPDHVARRDLHVSRATPATRTSRAGSACCTKATRWRSWSSRRAARRPTATSASSRCGRRNCTSGSPCSSARRTRSISSRPTTANER